MSDSIEVTGEVVSCLPSTVFMVHLENGMTIRANLAGRLRKHRIRISVGDRVKVEISPYDLEKGRIVYRMKDE